MIKDIVKNFIFIVSSFFHLPHAVFYVILHDLIIQDMVRYNFYNRSLNVFLFLRLVVFMQEFRALFYYRIGLFRCFIQWIHPVRLNLYILTPDIGGGVTDSAWFRYRHCRQENLQELLDQSASHYRLYE